MAARRRPHAILFWMARSGTHRARKNRGYALLHAWYPDAESSDGGQEM
jgi:hypothetical protein